MGQADGSNHSVVVRLSRIGAAVRRADHAVVLHAQRTH